MTSQPIPAYLAGLCAGTPVAFMTTIRPDGRLSTNPVAVVLGDDGLLRVSTTTARRKYRNLRADDRVTLCIVQPGNLNRYVEVRGRARLEIDEDRSFIDSIAARYMGVDEYPFDRPDDVRVTITVLPEQISAPDIPLADAPPYRDDAEAEQ